MGFSYIRHEFINNAQSFSGRAHHNDRTLSSTPKNVISEKTHLNISLVEPKTYSSAELLNGVRKEMNEHKKQNPESKNRNIKQGAAFAFETFIEGSGLSNEDLISFLTDAFEKFKEKYKGHEIISAAIHMDESKPHLHIITSFFNHEKKKWSRTDLFGYDVKKGEDRSFKKEQDWIYEVGKKYNLKRGKDKKLTQREHQHPLHPNQVDKEKDKVHQHYVNVIETDPELKAGYAKSRSMKMELLTKNYKLTSQEEGEAIEAAKRNYKLSDSAVDKIYKSKQQEKIIEVDDYFTKLMKDVWNTTRDNSDHIKKMEIQKEFQRLKDLKQKTLEDLKKKSLTKDF